MILSGLIIIALLIIIPFGIGLIPTAFIAHRKVRPVTVYIAGFVCSMALFQLVAVPTIILSPYGFPVIVAIYLSLTIALAVTGGVITFITIKRHGNPFKYTPETPKNMSREELVMWIIAGVLILLQLVMFVTMESFDGDDAYYVVESLLTTQTDTLYRIRPYTGLSTGMDLRHALATTPVWEAYIARLAGVHSTILAHSVMGLILIPIMYMLYYEVGRILCKKELRKLPVFMIFVALMNIFGNVSIYTNATFLLTRTWQGKSLLANMAITCVIWLLLCIFESDITEHDHVLGYWIMLGAINTVAAMASTASVFLIAMLIGISGLVLSIMKKDVQILLKLMITCVPLIVFGVMFLLI